MSYNIHKGFNLWGSQYTFDSLRSYLIESDAEIVFLQECAGQLRPQLKSRTRRGPDSQPFSEQLELLADSIWTDFAYGKNAVFNDGHHGNAILSKFPISVHQNHDLSLNRWEKRGLLHAEIEVQSSPLHLFCTHLNLRQSHRNTQLNLIQDILKIVPQNEPILLAGDFNDWRKSLDKKLTQQSGLSPAFDRPPLTYPSVLPALSLDRIYYRGLELKKSWTGDKTEASHSDHLPIFAEFDLNGK